MNVARHTVRDTLGKRSVRRALQEVVLDEASLWGVDRIQNMVSETIILALYKDIMGIGYDALIAQV